MKTKEPKITLINWTKNPIETMCWCRRVMHSPVPDSINEIIKNPKKWLGMAVEDYVEKILLNDGMPTFLEYVNVVFKLENVSRALQQQLTRHRIGFSYSIQSLRCVNLPDFADEGHYHNPFVLSKEQEKFLEENPFNAIENDLMISKKARFDENMTYIQKKYRKALEKGMPTQSARGLLPMNIYSTITFRCTLRALISMLNKRLCLKTQGEFRKVAKLMLKEISNKMDPKILKWIGPPCEKQGYCMMKAENEIQYQENKLTGKQNTDYVCPNYIKIFKGDKDGKK